MSKPENKDLAAIVRESLQNGRQPGLTVTSNSMAPLIRAGDQITLQQVVPSQLQPGDIITFEMNDYLLTHRFWEWRSIEENKSIISRGDRPLAFDPPAPEQSLIGQVISRKRKDEVLYLNSGWGKRLNQHLAWLARQENRCLRRTHCGWWVQGLHMLKQSWAALLTAIINQLSK